MFRRAANYIARVEDALIFYGRTWVKNSSPPVSTLTAAPNGIPLVYDFTQDAHDVSGLIGLTPPATRALAAFSAVKSTPKDGALGDGVFKTIVSAIDALESAGQLGPFACILGEDLFEAVCTPNGFLVLPRDRILPFLQGPLVRSSVLASDKGLVIALSGNPIELVVASDIQVSYLQTSTEPRWVFRVSERVALRIKETKAVREISK